jgi:hypothetical protein
MNHRPIPPAPGLQFLTTRQVIELDDYLATAAAAIRPQRTGAILTLVMNEHGQLVQYGEPMLLSRINARLAA